MRNQRLGAFGCAKSGLMIALAIGVTAASSAPSRAYDMDCKLILCIAGGFPASCGDAYSYMIGRIKDRKPPVGVCSYAGPEGDPLTYSAAQARLGTDRWTECPGDVWRTECERGDCYEYCVAGLREYEQRFIEIDIPTADPDGPPFHNHVRFGAKREVEERDGGGD